MTKDFSELSDGTKFTFNGQEYEKISVVKISCCKSVNAKAVANTSQRVFIQPKARVEVSE